MPVFASAAWCQAAADAVAGSEELATATRGVSLSVSQRIEPPDDDVLGWTIHVDDGRCRLTPGPDDTAGVRFSQDLDTAVAIARGDLSAQAAFLCGRLRIGGDVTVLVAHAPALGTLERALAGLRAATTWP